MSDKISMLQLGDADWSSIYNIPDKIEFSYMEEFDTEPDEQYDIVFIDRAISDAEAALLLKAVKAYTMFVTDTTAMTGAVELLYRQRKGQIISKDKIQDFLNNEADAFFPKPYGEKYEHNKIAVSRNYEGKVEWNGNYNIRLCGDFGNEYNQVIYWRNNIPLQKGQYIDLWLEYDKDEDVSIIFTVTMFRQGEIQNIVKRWEFDEEALKNIVTIDSPEADSYVFMSISAKGSGKLDIIALHDRYSRRKWGYFLPGGDRYVTSKREEVFFYFDPGDLKPPLNIYFSGYKTLEGFEGYRMMRSKGCPFLLVTEARLEGGGFYMGTKEYENLIKDCIIKYMNELGFSSDEVIFSGLSMGTFGAMYYGCDIQPHAIILGKPLASIGNVATNEKKSRPGGFPTSLDVLMYNCSKTDEMAVKRLNQKFWNKFDAAKWNKSKFIISYMIEDDYDSDAYNTLISHVCSEGVQVYGKGIHGRHNDDTFSITGWFRSQFDRVLSEDFSRRTEK